MKSIRIPTAALLAVALATAAARAEDKPAAPAVPAVPAASYDRKADVIYGRLPGAALTMDVFTPKADAKTKANGGAVIWVVSGGWASAHESIDNKFFGKSIAESMIEPMVGRGYTVFAVVHASQPKYTITEILPQINRAVRYIRTNAKDFGVDENRIGIVGASAGGHLSLMQGLSPQPANEKSLDPVDRASSKVRAVAAFVPPTDFLNYGKEGVNALGQGPLGWLKAPFDFHDVKMIGSTFGPTKQQPVYERIIDPTRLEQIAREISPIYQIDKDDSPVLVIHGEVDRLVPVQQAHSLKAKLDEMKVANELIVREKADHGWPGMTDDMQIVANWFDKRMPAKE